MRFEVLRVGTEQCYILGRETVYAGKSTCRPLWHHIQENSGLQCLMLIIWSSSVLLAWLVKTFLAFYGTQRFLPVPSAGPHPEPNESSPQHHSQFLKGLFYYSPVYAKVFQVFCIQVFLLKLYIHILYCPLCAVCPHLCGVVVRVPGYRSRGPGFDSRSYQICWEVVGLGRGPLGLVSTTEELLGRKSGGSGLENRE
jgi:hypothetical protein